MVIDTIGFVDHQCTDSLRIESRRIRLHVGPVVAPTPLLHNASRQERSCKVSFTAIGTLKVNGNVNGVHHKPRCRSPALRSNRRRTDGAGLAAIGGPIRGQHRAVFPPSTGKQPASGFGP
jgi:hypothetical protein